MSHKHTRSSDHGRKLLPTHARPSKPPVLKRGNSYNNNNNNNNSNHHHHAPSQGQSGSSSKPTLGAYRKVGITEVVQQDEEVEDMASFLQFCATCETQIITPGVSLLYCSEACRRKDNTKPAPLPTPPITPSSSSYFDVPTVDILPQRSPTVIRPVSLTFSDLSIDDDPNSSSDEDDSTEPTRYLTDFPPNTWTTDSKLPRRPQYTRASTTTTGSSSSALPSLIHSPTSSVGTLASISSSRPLPSRRLNSHNNNNKLIDLVTPFPTTSTPLSITPQDGSLTSSASTLTSFRVVEADDLSYAKCPPDGDDRGRRRRSQAQGSLKQLFSHEAIRAAPVDGCVLKQ